MEAKILIISIGDLHLNCIPCVAFAKGTNPGAIASWGFETNDAMKMKIICSHISLIFLVNLDWDSFEDKLFCPFGGVREAICVAIYSSHSLILKCWYTSIWRIQANLQLLLLQCGTVFKTHYSALIPWFHCCIKSLVGWL